MKRLIEQGTEWILFLLRILLGGFIALHGIIKVTDISQANQTFEEAGIPVFLGNLTGIIEIIVGATLIVGLLVKSSAIVVALLLIISILLAPYQEGMISYYELLLPALLLAVLLSVRGSRKLNLVT